MLWSAYRTQIRRSILKDPDGKNWTNDQLLDYLHDAIKMFCSHTAVATSFSADGDDEATVFALPSNLYETPEKSGAVFTLKSDVLTYLAPVDFADWGDADETNYANFPDGSITLFSALPSGTSLEVKYYAIPTLPLEDSDLVPIPDWAHAAIKYMIAVYALSAPAVRQANIRQWGTDDDSGNPEHNSFDKPMKWFIDQYEIELSKYQRQNRTGFRRRA